MSDGVAFWISPTNDVYKVETKHIEFVNRNLELFDLTLEQYQSYFKKHNERFGWEGNARTEMFIEFFKKGWIRIRESSQNGWTIECWDITFHNKPIIEKWCKNEAINHNKFLNNNVVIHLLKYEDVKETKPKKFQINTTIGELGAGITLKKLGVRDWNLDFPNTILPTEEVCQNCKYLFLMRHKLYNSLCMNDKNLDNTNKHLHVKKGYHKCDFFEFGKYDLPFKKWYTLK